MKFDTKRLNEISALEATTMFKERVAVFVVEQNCPYQEIDVADYHALHIRLMEENTLVAYSRIYEKDENVTFGRVLVKKEFRKNKHGRNLIEETLKQAEMAFPNKPILISAQTYLIGFYSSFGFKPVSEPYLEDNIPHIDMLLEK